MLGSFLFRAFTQAMPSATISKFPRGSAVCTAFILIFFLSPSIAFAQTTAKAPSKTVQAAPKLRPARPASEGVAALEADQQRQVGKVFYADGHVDVSYENYRIRADHAEYNSETGVVNAAGHVQLDYLTQHVEADDVRYELRTGRGLFHHVRATFAVQRRPTPTLLISPNPLYFEAEEAERVNENTYRVRKAWMTVCDCVFAQVGASRERKFSRSLDSGGLFSVRNISRRTPARFRIHDSRCWRQFPQRLSAGGVYLLGSDGLGGRHCRRRLLQQARVEPVRRYPYAPVGKRAA
jgi:hypothetical protein